MLDSLDPRSARASWWSPPVLQGKAVKISLASVSSGIHAMWLNREKRCAWTITERCGCPVVRVLFDFHAKIWLENYQIIMAVRLIGLEESRFHIPNFVKIHYDGRNIPNLLPVNSLDIF